MSPERLFILSSSPDLDTILAILRSEDPEIKIAVIANAREFKHHVPDISGNSLLLSYDNGLVVPAAVLDTLDRPAYNFHPAPPEYPGRDPYHFAVYDGVVEYGATAHEIIASVDAGAIVAVERFAVPPDSSPEEILGNSRMAMLTILKRLAPSLIRGMPIEPTGEKWGSRKTTRADFFGMCELPHDIDREEFDRRYRAFDGGDHDNLIVTLHGKRFRIEKNG